jgi:hypothetical protein
VRVPLVKIVVAKIGSKKRRPRRRAVTTRRVRDRDGEFTTQFWLDHYSPTFDEDLTSVFKRNVARVRLDNERVLGSPDGFKKNAAEVAEKFVALLKSAGSPDATRKK